MNIPETQCTCERLLHLLKFNSFKVHNIVLQSPELSLIVLMIFDLQI